MNKIIKLDNKYFNTSSKNLLTENKNSATIFDNEGELREAVELLKKHFGNVIVEELTQSQFDGITFLINDEDEAIEGYEEQKKQFADDPEAIKLFDHIIAEEKEHKKELQELLAKRATKNHNVVETVFEDLKGDEADKIKHIEDFINNVYELRKNSIAKEGEYGIGNLVFKELRDKGYLDNLRERKTELLSQKLSLESFDKESKDDYKLYSVLTDESKEGEPYITGFILAESKEECSKICNENFEEQKKIIKLLTIDEVKQLKESLSEKERKDLEIHKVVHVRII